MSIADKIILYDFNNDYVINSDGSQMSSDMLNRTLKLFYQDYKSWQIQVVTVSGTTLTAVDLSSATAWQSAVNSVYSVTDVTPMCRTLNASIDSSNASGGILTIKLDANTTTFLTALESDSNITTNGGISALWEVQGFNSLGKRIFYFFSNIQARTILDPNGGDPGDPASNYYTKTEVDGKINGSIQDPSDSTTGDILYHNGSTWVSKHIGTNGQVLTLSSGLPAWENPSSSSIAWGTITGALSSQMDLQTALNAKQNTITVSGILKGSGSSVSAATAGTDYAIPATTLAGYGIADGLKTSNNLSDLTSVSSARTNLGLAASATTDTTNASNISSGTLGSSYLPEATTSAKGAIQLESSGDTTKYLNGNGAWTVPAGSGSSGVTSISATSPIVTSTSVGAVALSHATSGVISGSYGSSSLVPVVTVDSNGHVTSMSTASISSGDGTITDNPQTTAYTQTATGQQIRFTSSTSTACTLTLMSPPTNGSAPTYVKNESNYIITLSGAINGTSSTTYMLSAGVSAVLVSDGTYWRVSRLDDALPDISSAATGQIASVTSNIVSSGGLAKWTLDNVLTDSFGSYTLTNSGLTFSTDSAFPLGSRYVGICNGSSYASFTPASLPTGASARTICGWFKTSTSSTQYMAGYGTASTGNEIGVGIYSDGRPYCEIYGTELFGTGSYKDGNWHFFAFVYNGSTMYIYADNTLNNSGSMTLNTTLTWGNIGGIRNGTGKFTGSLADFRIYNRALSTTELSLIYAGDIGSSWQLTPSYSLQNIASRASTTPTIAAGAGAGTSPAVSITGTDSSGQITVATGTSPTAAGTVATVTFASVFPNTPVVVLSPANANAAVLYSTTQVYANSTTSAMTVTAGSAALTASTSYIWNYKCF